MPIRQNNPDPRLVYGTVHGTDSRTAASVSKREAGGLVLNLVFRSFLVTADTVVDCWVAERVGGGGGAFLAVF